MTGETLTRAQLAQAKPVGSENGSVWRAYCPFHGSDKQRSLRIKIDTGHFVCFACGVWGYLEDARQRNREQWKQAPFQPQKRIQVEPEARPGLDEALEAYQKALPGSPGSTYLKSRGIALSHAQAHGIGYAAPGRWLNPNRDWKFGRLVFPHHNPAGHLVNLYGRAVEIETPAPGEYRHDHLPGSKGYFGAACLQTGETPVHVCEGAFDSLSLSAAGCSRVIAIFGLHGWRWQWFQSVHHLIFALDADQAGQTAWRDLARQACYRGKKVGFLPPEAYGGAKDVNEAWLKGTLRV